LGHEKPPSFENENDASPPAATPPAASVDAPRPPLDLLPLPPLRERAPRSRPPEPEVDAQVRGPAIRGAPPPRIVRHQVEQLNPSPTSPVVSLTYEPFYGFAERPFGPFTDPAFVYHSRSFDRTLQEVIDTFARGGEVAVLTGDAGIGKTTLCRALVQQLGQRAMVSFITAPAPSLEDLLTRVLVDFGVVSSGGPTPSRLAAASRQDLMSAIGDFAASLVRLEASAVIIVDDAQNVSAEALEALSTLVDRPGQNRRLHVLLVARSDFLATLGRAELRSVERRLAVRCHLEPLTPDETAGYVMHRLAVAGPKGRLTFDRGAFAKLHAVTRGVPHLIDLACDRALARGCEAGAGVIDETLIAAAAADLRLAPATFAADSPVRWVIWTVALLALMLAAAVVAAWLLD
jgi:general secretion pathway protein A